jgi:hypothetical protein
MALYEYSKHVLVIQVGERCAHGSQEVSDLDGVVVE